MKLFNNTYCPIPLFSSKDYWSDNLPTYHGVSQRLAFATDDMLRLSYNFSDDALKRFHAVPSSFTVVYNDTTYTFNYTRSSLLNRYLTHQYTAGTLTFSLASSVDTGDSFYITMASGGVAIGTFYANQSRGEFSLYTILSANEQVAYTVDVTPAITIIFTAASSTTLGTQITASTAIYHCDNTLSHTATTIHSFYEVSSGVYSAEVYQDSSTSLALSEGNYYIQETLSVLGVATSSVFVSEPFSVVAASSHYVSVAMTSTQSIYVGGSLVRFPASFSFMVQSGIINPPYQFEAEVEEIDGYKFVKKLVSYKQGTLSFLATEYTADCIRLLWHCNDVTLVHGLSTYKVDYLEPPEIAWDDDNHLCSVTLTFQCDTITQTNGVSSAV